ncbi:MAG: serpin family protein [Planctomycetes bacterium]|nr:serpin family protein [Planctomycetota bacterium]
MRIVVLSTFVLVSALMATTGQTQDKSLTQPLVAADTEFALDLYARLAQEKGNLFFSPYSISNALAMTYAGAKGNTALEMKKVLRFPFDQDGVNQSFAQLIREIQDRKAAKYKLVVANRLFGQKDYGFLPSFLKTTQVFYGAPLEEVDFNGAAEDARKTINSWVEKQTQNKIKDLIQPGVLDAQTRLVLANAIYFKAAWMNPFAEKQTKPAPFYAPDTKVNVATMHGSIHTRFFKGDGFSALELPYEQNDLSMVLFLPEKNDGLAAFEKKMTAATLKEWLAKLSNHQVTVSLPKFKLSAEFQLNQALAALGMKDAFTDKADFSGMTSRDKLSISAVVHKAFIDVNEAGTEAAAATAVVMRLSSAIANSATFNADHPFVYLIRDNRTGSVLFMGRVVNPS